MPAAFDLALQAGGLLFDGPIGTELLSRGQRPPLEELNASAPALVREVHKSYLGAGAHVLRANTFRARNGVVEDPARLNRLGMTIAREAAGPGVWVGASVGGPHEPPPPGHDRQPPPGFAEAVAEQVEALAAVGADFLSFETFLRSEDLEAALEAARGRFAGPVLASLTLRADTPTRLDAMSVQRLYETLGRFLEVAAHHNAAGVGANCVPPGATLELVRDFLAREASQPWGILPSTPVHAAGRRARPGDGAEPAEGERLVLAACEAALDAGASFVGGCCGVGPGTIRRLGKLLRSPLEHMREEEARRARFGKGARVEASPVPRPEGRGRDRRPSPARPPGAAGRGRGDLRPREDRPRRADERPRQEQRPRRWEERSARPGEGRPRRPDHRPRQEPRPRRWEDRRPRQGEAKPHRPDQRPRPPDHRQREGQQPRRREEGRPPRREEGRERPGRPPGVAPLWNKRPLDPEKPRGRGFPKKRGHPAREEGLPKQGSGRPWQSGTGQPPRHAGRRRTEPPRVDRPPRSRGGPPRGPGSERGPTRPRGDRAPGSGGPPTVEGGDEEGPRT